MIALGLMLLTAAPPSAQSLETSKQSVVQVRCAFADGKSMKATGFVWPRPGYIVTALHVIAGCDKGTVLHERAGLANFAEIVSVDRDSDLALIRLDKDLGLPPVPFRHDGPPPDLLKPHRIYGYPKLAERLRGDGLKFADTLTAEPVQLGRAYSSTELTRLFRDQDYPHRKTQIYQVGSLLQPGHSGAPIFDELGNLVAIGDGGLLGGWLGMNWSIPAHVYLPELETSQDALPREMSKWAGLFSNVVVTEPQSVRLGPQSAEPEEPAEEEPVAVGWQSIGFLPLAAIVEDFAFSGNEAYDNDFALIQDVLGDAERDIGFEVFEYSDSGVVFALPSGFEAEISILDRELSFVSSDGVFTMIARVQDFASYTAAVFDGVRPFVTEHANLAKWYEGEQDDGTVAYAIKFDDVETDAELEFALYEARAFGEAYDSNHYVGIELKAGVNGDRFFGAALTSSSFEEFDQDQQALEAMLWIGYSVIAGFNGLADVYFNAIETYEPPSELTLVRRVALRDVARDFVAERDFGWKRDVFDIKGYAGSQDAYEKLSFDIYEDSETGATVAIPTGMSPVWNDDIGALEVYSESGHSRMNIAVVNAEDFEQAIGDVYFSFAQNISNFARWKGNGSPEDCADEDVDFEAQNAECWLYLQVATADDSLTDIYIGMSVKENVFLGTSVYIEGDEEEMSAKEAIEYRMMKIAAEYLSDFAVY